MDKISEDKICTEGAILISTLLGGPLGAFYLISRNFKVFKKLDKARKSLLHGIIFISFLGVISFLLPEPSDLSNPFVVFIFCIPMMYVKHFQITDIKNALKQGMKKISYLQIIFVSSLSLLITFLLFVCISLILLVITDQLSWAELAKTSMNMFKKKAFLMLIEVT